jgi:hypothetical protein
VTLWQLIEERNYVPVRDSCYDEICQIAELSIVFLHGTVPSFPDVGHTLLIGIDVALFHTQIDRNSFQARFETNDNRLRDIAPNGRLVMAFLAPEQGKCNQENLK